MDLIWNPWHGCRKISEGCLNCYMYFLDKLHGQDGRRIFRVKNNFNLPVAKDKNGQYKVKSGTTLLVCLTSDFFLEEADPWRIEAWDFIQRRNDVLFHLITKRAERIEKCLPLDWGDGWPNVWINVTAENQKRADQRIPVIIDLPFKYRGVMAAPLLGEIHIEKYLSKLNAVSCDGENYDGARVCDYDWVKSLYEQCRCANVDFKFFGTGALFRKNGRLYHIPPDKQDEQAQKSGLQFKGPGVDFKPPDTFQQPDLFGNTEFWKPRCAKCRRRENCPGCRNCGRCGQ